MASKKRKKDLSVYDKLREAHTVIKGIDYDALDYMEQVHLDGVHSVLYMAEAFFCGKEYVE